MAITAPTTIDGFDCEWLTDALRTASVIGPQASVSGVESELLGDGEGFVGDIARLALTYRDVSEASAAPSSVIVKIPTVVDRNRATGKSLNVYEREVRAYDTLLARVDVPHPAVHLAVYEATGEESALLERMIKAERLPLWLLRPLVRRVQSDSDVPPCALVLEDLADAVPGDQVTGCDPERAAVALTAAARMHASTWGARCPRRTHWFTDGDVVPRIFHATYQNGRRHFERHLSSIFSPASMALVRSIRREGLPRITRLHAEAPRCLVHGDYRLDNMFFAPDGNLRAVIDWQTVNRGPAVLDVGYFVMGSLAADTPEVVVDDLLAHYHDELVAAGVDDYPLDTLRRHYDEGLLLLLHRMSGIDSLEFGDARGADLIDGWFRRVDARLGRLTA